MNRNWKFGLAFLAFLLNSTQVVENESSLLLYAISTINDLGLANNIDWRIANFLLVGENFSFLGKNHKRSDAH